MPIITEERRTQFREEGYFILERAVSEEQLKILREACDHLIEAMHAEMDRLCLLYTSPSPRDATLSRMPSSA